MFSRRTPASLVPNRITQAIGSLRGEGKSWIDLTLSNPTQAGIEYPAEHILPALTDPRSLTYHPAPFGLDEAREAIAAYYRERSLDADPARTILSASTSESRAESWARSR